MITKKKKKAAKSEPVSSKKKISKTSAKKKVEERPVKSKSSRPVPAPEKKVKARLNLAEARRIGQEVESGGKFFKFDQGLNSVRFMPNPGDDLFFVHCQSIYIPDPTNPKKGKYFVSPKSAGSDNPCPAQAAYEALWRKGDEASKELAGKIRPSHSFYSNAMVKNRSTGKWEFKVVQYGVGIYKTLLAAMEAEAEGEDLDDEGCLTNGGIIADPVVGRIVSIKKSGADKGTKYEATVTSKELPLEKAWIKQCQDLSQEAIPSDYDAIEAAVCAFLGIDELSELTSPVAAAKGKKSRDDDEEEDDEEEEEDDEEEEEEEDEDEEEEKPKPSKKSSKRPVEDDDEDEDEDDEEEDEEEEDGEEEDDEEEDEEEEEEEDEPPVKKKKRVVEEDEEDEEEEDDDEEEEEDEPPAKKRQDNSKRVNRLRGRHEKA